MRNGKMMEVQTATKIDLSTGLLLTTVFLCGIMTIGAFGAAMAAIATSTSSTTNPTAVFCSETDKGQDYNTAGTIKILYSNNAQRIEQDTCNADGTLREWYCGKVGDPAGLLRSNNYYKCPNGCRAGACIAVPVCVDSDIKSEGGDDYFMQGYTAGMGVDGKQVAIKDFCYKSSSTPVATSTGPLLMEYSCINNTVQPKPITCSNGCLNGACKPDPIYIQNSAASNQPASQIVTPKTTNIFNSIDFTASIEPMKITRLELIVFHHLAMKPLNSVTITYKNQFGVIKTKTAVPVDARVVFSGLDMYVPKSGSKVNLLVKGLTATVSTTNSVSGDMISVGFENRGFEAVGLKSGKVIKGAVSNISGNFMYLRYSKPTLTILQPSNKLSGGNIKIADIFIKANGGGDVIINQIPISMNILGKFTVATSKIALKVNDISVPVTESNISYSPQEIKTNIRLSNSYRIPAGQSKKFSVYVTIDGMTTSTGPSSLSTSLGSKAYFLWSDKFNVVTDGSYVMEYPIGSVVIKN